MSELHRSESDVGIIAEMLRRGGVIALTGAGCSTPSGIGDYRDEQGQWKRRQPVQHKDFLDQAAWRRRYWARSQVGYPEFLRAAPNAAHHCLARWEAHGLIRGIITQNVDRLHQRAGNQNVIDLHGRLDQVVCMACRKITPRGDLQTWLERMNPEVSLLKDEAVMAPDGDADLVPESYAGVCVPDCDHCGGVLKPDVVFYGDSVPRSVVDTCYRWVDEARALLIIGSSLMVFSSFRFVRRAAERGIPVYAVNRGRTRGDEYFAVKIDADCVETLDAIDAGVRVRV